MATPLTNEQIRTIMKGAGPPPADTMAPRVPEQRKPDLDRARQELLDAAEARTAMSTPGAEGWAEARDILAAAEGRPEPTPAEPTLWQFAQMALQPKIIPSTERRRAAFWSGTRQMTPEEEISAGRSALAHHAIRGATFALGPGAEKIASAAVPSSPHAQGVAEAIGLTGDPTDAEGLKAENETLYLIRLIGSVAPAILTETAERHGVPNLSRAPLVIDKARSGDLLGAYQELVNSTWGDESSTLGGLILGVEPGTGQKIRREGGLADWTQGVLERIDSGRGLESDVAASFKERFGPEYENYGWWLGLAIDTLTDWEGALASGPKVVASLNRRVGLIREGTKGLDLPEMPNAFVHALKNNEVEIGDWLGGKLAQALEDGHITIDQLPAAIRVRAEEVALNRHGMSLDELSRHEGVGVSTQPVQLEGEFVAGREAIEAAKKSGEKIPGVDEGAFADRPQLERTGKVVDSRQVTPAFGREVGSAEEFWQEVTRVNNEGRAAALAAGVPFQGYKRIPGEGFRRMIGNAGMTIDRPRYALRNAAGDILNEGTFEDVVAGDHKLSMMSRQRDGDEVWWDGTKRRVASWGAVNKPHLTADRDFASSVEERMMSLLRKTDPRAFPMRVKQLAAEAAAKGTTPRTVGKALADTLTDAPLKGRKATTRTGDVAVTAARLAGRDAAGSDLLAALPTGAVIAKIDRDRIVKAVTERLDSFSMGRKAAEAIHRGAAQTPAQLEGLAQLAAEVGTVRKEGQTFVDFWDATRKAAMTKAAGDIGDLRYRIRGSESVWRSMLAVFADAHLDRRKRTWIEETGRKLPLVERFSKAFLEDTFGRLPPAVKSSLTELRTGLERNSDELMIRAQQVFADARQRAGRFATIDPASALHELVGEYVPIRQADMDLAEQIVTAPTDAASMAALRDRVMAEWRGPKPRWFDPAAGHLLVADGVHRWGVDQLELGAEHGREWVRAHMIAAGQNVGFGTDLHGSIAMIPVDRGVAVYRELLAGDLEGPKLKDAIGRMSNAQAPLKLDPEKAIATYLLSQRAGAKIAETMDRMLASGFVVRATDIRGELDRKVGARPSALVALAKGAGQHFDEGMQRWVYEYPEAQITYASNRLRDWGVDIGSGATLKQVKIGGRPVVLPEYLAEEIGRLTAAGLTDSRNVFNVKALDNITRLFKQWTTHGYILPNPAYFTGQFLGMFPTLVTTQGWAGAASATVTLLKHPIIIGEIMRRLSGGGFPTYLGRVAESRFVQSADGGLISVDAFTEAAKRHGLADTTTSFETGRQLEGVIALEGRRWFTRMPIMAAQGWQQLIRAFAGSIDQSMRLAVFIDEAVKGIPLDKAAETARASLLDFRDLTRFEAEKMRMMFTFYAFMRKNMDAHMRALFEHPGRIGSQLRLAHASLTDGGLSALQLGQMKEEDVARLNAYTDRDVVNDQGRPHPLYKMTRLQTTPIGATEFLIDMRALMLGPFGFVGVGPNPEADKARLLGNLSPFAQTFAILGLGQKLGTETDIGGVRSNRIPPVLMDSFLAPYISEVFGVGPAALGQDEDVLVGDEDAKNEFGSMHAAVWAAGADPHLTPAQAELKRRLWQTTIAWIGRPLSTATQTGQGFGIVAADPYLTQKNELVSALSGLNWKAVPDDTEVVRRALIAKQARLGDKTELVRELLPDKQP